MDMDCRLIQTMFRGMEGAARLTGSDMAAHMPTLYLLARLGAKVGAVVELGVAQGYSTVSLLAGAMTRGVRLWSYDVNASCGGALERLGIKPEGHTQIDWTFLAKDSLAAAKDWQEGSVGLLFLDTVHTFDVTLAELEAWFPRIHGNGIMCGHDYLLQGAGVQAAVGEFLRRHPGRFRMQVDQHDQGLFILWPLVG